jgi:predicted metal-dependent TIM-barrel fold hydrolase
MISPLLLLAIAAPGSSGLPPNPNAQRLAFIRCLSTTVSDEMKSHSAAEAFKAKMATVCKTEEEAFRQASVKADLAMGIKSAAAQENASSEIKDIVATQSDRFQPDPPPKS